MHSYCDFFKTVYDETEPTGYLGRGTHYSVLRAMVFHDVFGHPSAEGQFVDFAVIWDADHDTRVIEVIEEIYRRGMLSSFTIFGERKGVFAGIVSGKVRSDAPKIGFNPAFLSKVDELSLSVRAATCLKNDYIVYIGDLVQKTEAEMLRTPNFGRKSLNEIKEVLVQMGLHLGTEIPHWPPSNIEELSENIERASEMYRVTFLKSETEKICQALDDPWRSIVVAPGDESLVVDDEKEKVRLYLKNIEMLWQLGANTKMKSPFKRAETDEITGAALASPRSTRNILRRI
jgi:hypothetical protein